MSDKPLAPVFKTGISRQQELNCGLFCRQRGHQGTGITMGEGGASMSIRHRADQVWFPLKGAFLDGYRILTGLVIPDMSRAPYARRYRYSHWVVQSFIHFKIPAG